MSRHLDGHRQGEGIAVGDIAVQDDLKRNPGTGQSKGLTGATDDEVDARTGGIDPKHLDRTNE